jgi:hypothetical protein
LFASLLIPISIAKDPTLILPDKPYGPTMGVVGEDYIFCFDLPNDAECEPYFVLWDWGDGTFTDWLGPYSAGETVCASHVWTEPGTYEIRVKIKDFCGNQYWSDPWVINIVPMTELDIKIVGGGLLKICAVIRNIGEHDAYNISWNINISGGFIIIGRETSGSFSEPLSPGEGITICSSLFFGFGLLTITAKARALNAEEVSDTLGGFLFLFYFIPLIPYLK